MTSSSKRLLVTGASGFLGSRIVDFALHAGWRVRAFNRSPRARIEGVETFVGDIGDSALLRKASEGVTAIVHAAGLAHVFGREAQNAARFNVVNEAGTASVIDAALESGAPNVVLVSSVSVYGDYPGALCDETAACNPRGPYAISKWRSEQVAAERMAKGRGSLTILRFGTMYGEGDRGNVARLISAIDRGHFVRLGDGQNRKSLLYKADAARACVYAAELPKAVTEIFNVTAPPVTMEEIVNAICQALGRPVPRHGIPCFLLKVGSEILDRLGDPGQLVWQVEKFLRDDAYDGSRFAATFNFSPETSVTEGVLKQVSFLRTGR